MSSTIGQMQVKGQPNHVPITPKQIQKRWKKRREDFSKLRPPKKTKD
jgi:hypothetical protein